MVQRPLSFSSSLDRAIVAAVAAMLVFNLAALAAQARVQAQAVPVALAAGASPVQAG